MHVLMTRPTYRKIKKAILDYKIRNFDTDRRENPNKSPCTYGPSLEILIQNKMRECHEYCNNDKAGAILEQFVQEGILVHYLGDYTFKSDEVLPSREQVEEETRKELEKLGLLKPS